MLLLPHPQPGSVLSASVEAQRRARCVPWAVPALAEQRCPAGEGLKREAAGAENPMTIYTAFLSGFLPWT